MRLSELITARDLVVGFNASDKWEALRMLVDHLVTAGRLDAVYSNRDRGWKIIADEALEDRVRYAGGHKEILYYSGIAKSYPDPAVVERFFEAWHAIFADGTAPGIIEGYGLEPAPAE